MTQLTAYPSDWFQTSDEPAWQRAASIGSAFILHVVAVALLLSLPPAVLIEARRLSQSLDVRFYTVSSDNADSDAPLIEPPLSDDRTLTETAPAPVVFEVPEEVLDEAEVSPEPPAPVETEANLPDPSLEELSSPQAESPSALNQPARPNTGARSQSAPPVPSVREILQTEGAVPTTQITPPPPSGPVRQIRFADILARVDQRLDPEDFQIVMALEGVRGAVRETFCLSSSLANLEAGECPEGPNARSAELARYGLQGLEDASPEFIEDLSRMEFELRQLGANPSQVQRIMLALREAQREAIETPGVLRAMERDTFTPGDNLGLGASVIQERARDPSGEN